MKSRIGQEYTPCLWIWLLKKHSHYENSQAGLNLKCLNKFLAGLICYSVCTEGIRIRNLFASSSGYYTWRKIAKFCDTQDKVAETEKAISQTGRTYDWHEKKALGTRLQPWLKPLITGAVTPPPRPEHCTVLSSELGSTGIYHSDLFFNPFYAQPLPFEAVQLWFYNLHCRFLPRKRQG